MKVYAVVKMYDDEYYEHYIVLKVFSNKDTAYELHEQLSEQHGEYVWFSIREWEVE